MQPKDQGVQSGPDKFWYYRSHPPSEHWLLWTAAPGPPASDRYEPPGAEDWQKVTHNVTHGYTSTLVSLNYITASNTDLISVFWKLILFILIGLILD